MERVQKTIRNITDLFIKEQTEILKAATLLMIPSLLTKVTGQVVVVLIATKLGTGKEIELFNLANTIPEALLNILLLGVVGVVVIPILVDSREKDGEARFLRVYNTILNAAMGLFVVASILLILVADTAFPWIIEHVIRPEPGTFSPDDITLVVEMMNFLMIPNIILGVSVMVSSGLNVYNRFLVPQLAPLFYNIGRIFGVFLLLPLMDNSPWALVIGILVGSILHLAVQLPLARIINLRYQFVLDLKDSYVKKLLRISIPRGFAFAAEMVGLTVMRLIATGVGGISVFNYANSLALVIPSLFGYPFAVASYPKLSSLYAKEEFNEMNVLVVKTLNQIFFLALPVTIAIMILRLPIVRLVFGILPGTAFSRDDTAAVAWTLLFFAVGVLFIAGKWFLYRIFYVAKDTVTPLVISIVALAIAVILSIWLTNLLSHTDVYALGEIPRDLSKLFVRGDGRGAIGGVALAFSLSSIVEFLLLLVFVNRSVLKLDFQMFFSGIVRKMIPGSAMTVLMYAMYKTWDTLAIPIDATPGFQGSTTINLAILTSITLITSFLVYYLLSYLFQVQELKILKRFLNPVFRLGGIEIS